MILNSDLNFLADFSNEKAIAVALSGGGDSMALAHLVSMWAKNKEIAVHFLTVDHGLRPDSKSEAKQVQAWIKNWPNVIHKILTWTGEKPQTKIQEAARNARYKLMADYSCKHKIKYLFLAHHGDDQIETFLFRLAKGSGLDGLTAMKPVQVYDANLTLLRPLLNFSHEELLSVCRKHKLPWIEDPSNDTDRFARVRLRKSRKVLEREGLTSERILTLSNRLERSRKALLQMVDKAEKDCILLKNAKRIEMNFLELQKQPEEIVLRLLQNCLSSLNSQKLYPAKLHNLEQIVAKLMAGNFKAASLSGSVVRLKKRLNIVEVISETK